MGLWLQNSSSAQNRIIRSNLKNTVKYVINTIQRIIRLRSMTHPCKQLNVLDALINQSDWGKFGLMAVYVGKTCL